MDKSAREAAFLHERSIPMKTVVEKTLRGVQRNQARVLIGRETLAIDWMKRLFPAGTDELMGRMKRHFPFL
jgi:hypothetical protein